MVVSTYSDIRKKNERVRNVTQLRQPIFDACNYVYNSGQRVPQADLVAGNKAMLHQSLYIGKVTVHSNGKSLLNILEFRCCTKVIYPYLPEAEFIRNICDENRKSFLKVENTMTKKHEEEQLISPKTIMELPEKFLMSGIYLPGTLLSKNLKVSIYKTIILPVVLYGCETWTLTLREEHRLRVFENKVLRKIFAAKRDEVTEEWRKLHNTELHALYSSPDIIRDIKSRRLRWAGHVARMGESRNAYRVLVGRPERKRPLGRPRRRWEDNIKMDLREVGCDDREWINLAQDKDQLRAYVRAAMNLRVP
ncbi:hypothetical protein ANN_14751 [Periplaneta americana]|uniref:Uncharacterized protein n=1 Tax=Periplaneta americana TaxID=6978 RepID=A0ABQ8SY96_PERAM|nr:hypothetical protein ANN_14751 [Periplaneta americana]